MERDCLMGLFERFVDWFNSKFIATWNRIYIGLAILALTWVVIVVTAYIILRKLTELRIYFVEEWSAFLLVLICYFSITHTLRMRGHIIVDMAVRYLSNMTRCILELITSLISLLLVVYFIQRGISFFWYNLDSHIVSESLVHTPMWIPALFVPVGLVLFALAILGYSLQKVVEIVHHSREEVTESPPPQI